MNIDRRNIDDLNAVLRVDITVDDYQEKVNGVLKKYQSTATESGFRKGRVSSGTYQEKIRKSGII